MTIIVGALLLTAAAQPNDLTLSFGQRLASKMDAVAGCDYGQETTDKRNGYCWTLNVDAALHKSVVQTYSEMVASDLGLTITTYTPWNLNTSNDNPKYSRLYYLNDHPYLLFIIQSTTNDWHSFGILIPIADE